MITIGTIAKNADSVIKKVEKELKREGDIFIDKKINARIEREISHLGKEKLIVDHINKLTRNFNKKNKNEILFLLVKLYNLNKQVNESLVKELKSDKKLLNKRIKTKIEKNKVHIDIYKKLLKIAQAHFDIVKKHAKTFDPKKIYRHGYILKIVHHKRKAEAIYDSLTGKNMKKIMHRILLKKLDGVYKALIDSTVDMANGILTLVTDIKNNKVSRFGKKTKEMQTIVSDKIDVLRSFAYKYSYNILHSEKFFDFKNKKIILITKKL